MRMAPCEFVKLDELAVFGVGLRQQSFGGVRAVSITLIVLSPSLTHTSAPTTTTPFGPEASPSFNRPTKPGIRETNLSVLVSKTTTDLLVLSAR